MDRKICGGATGSVGRVGSFGLAVVGVMMVAVRRVAAVADVLCLGVLVGRPGAGGGGIVRIREGGASGFVGEGEDDLGTGE